MRSFSSFFRCVQQYWPLQVFDLHCSPLLLGAVHCCEGVRSSPFLLQRGRSGGNGTSLSHSLIARSLLISCCMTGRTRLLTPSAGKASAVKISSSANSSPCACSPCAMSPGLAIPKRAGGLRIRVEWRAGSSCCCACALAFARARFLAEYVMAGAVGGVGESLTPGLTGSSSPPAREASDSSPPDSFSSSDESASGLSSRLISLASAISLARVRRP